MSYLDDLESERLIYKPLSLDYLEQWTKYLANSENTGYYPVLPLTPSERSKSWIESQLLRYSENTYGMYAVHLKENNAFIGQSGALLQEVNGRLEVEVGYHFFKEYTRKGYATEAAIHFRKWAFKNHPTSSIISIIREDNLPSQKVAIRNGMSVDFETTWKEMRVKIFRIQRDAISK